MNGNKKILFLSYDGMTDPLGQSQVLPYLKGLSGYGYSFTILSCEKPDIYKKNKELILESIEGYPINWAPVPFLRNPFGISTFLNLRNLNNAADKLQLINDFDMVHSRSGPATGIALRLKKKYKTKFLNDIRGFWADERVDGNMWNKKNPLFKILYRYFKNLEFECLRNADYNVCLTYAAKKEISSWENNIPSPLNLEVIPCSVDLKLFNSANLDEKTKAKLKSELGVKDSDIIITYLGSIGGWYLTAEMMLFCKVLSDIVPQVKFLFIAPHRHDLIRQIAGKYNIPEDKIIITHGTRNEVPALLSFGKYSLFFIKECYSKLASSPTKHAEIMAMGIPVITNSGIGDVENIVNKYHSGIILQKLDMINYNKAAKKIQENIHFDSAEIRHGAEEYYSLENSIGKYLKVYQSVLGKSASPFSDTKTEVTG
jgi:glycosyltransferase involved in cell wall biosynthesis